MSLRRSESPALSDGEVWSEAEEKANSSYATKGKDSKVNKSARPHQNGASSRAARIADLSRDRNYHFRRDDEDEDRVRSSAAGRERDRSRSPYRRDRSRSRSRSPYRAGKSTSGEKRRRDDDHYNAKAGSDPRRFKVHYEEKSGSRGGVGYGSQRPYADPDRPQPPKTLLRYDDNGPRGQGRPHRERDRDRSRSPYRPGKTDRPLSRGGSQKDGYGGGSRVNGIDGFRERRGSTPSVTDRDTHPQAPNQGAKVKLSLSQRSKQPGSQGSSHPAAESSQDNDESQSKLSEAEIIEQRRKRREAIKARHKSQPGLLVQALEHNVPSAPATPAADSSAPMSEQHSPTSSLNSPRTPHRDSSPGSPAAFAVVDDEELANRHQGDASVNEDEGPSAADYDPNMDMQEDRPDHKRQGVEAPSPSGIQPLVPQAEPEPAPKPSKEFDMFADDDDDDMFAPTDNVSKPATNTKQAKTLDMSLLDNWDYPDGHYRIILGELLDNRYAVKQQIGKGTFASVVRAEDTNTGNFVAIKIAANNETMYKAGQREMDFLKILNETDPDDKKHVIRLLRNFDHKGHMCIVFEALSADLREVLKKFGRNVGLNLKAIRSYAQQMFLALSHMKKNTILHADLKPDNILVSERRNLLKLCDLGTAAYVGDTEITPYLVSRFYRAPEVILGMPFDYAIDMWSIGCTLFELYTGRILFAGADNNQMLRAIQECRGKIPNRMLKLSHEDQRLKHFDLNGNFFSGERDKITGKTMMRALAFKSSGEAGKDLKSRLSGNVKGLAPAEAREHAAFVDLLEKCLQLDPGRRVSPNDALRHGFIAHAALGAQGGGEGGQKKVVPAMGVPRAR